MTWLYRVESIAKTGSFSVDFSDLRSSISALQNASAALDVEKVDAEKKFKKALKRLPKSPSPSESILVRWVRWVIDFLLDRKGAMRRFIKAAKRVQKVNGKLAAFERGFIQEDGIKDREWYRHLVIAPGKWLGTS